MLRLLLIVALATTAVVADVSRYDNYKVFEITPNTTAHLDLLRELGENPYNVSNLKIEKKLCNVEFCS